MIQANELRIGNAVNIGYDCTILRLYDVAGCCVNTPLGVLPQTNVMYEDLRPIPLTEDILLKCGFEHSTEGGTQYFKITIKYSKALSLLQDEGESDYGAVLSVSNGTLTESHSVIGLGQMNHLHQLQNLYFALTGQELNVEL